MAVDLAELLVRVLAIYAGIGFVFAVAFVIAGVGRIDPNGRGSTLGFRLLVLPGATALWPLLAWRWLRRQQAPPERNAHDRAAARRGR